jgi:hypothetical protein
VIFLFKELFSNTIYMTPEETLEKIRAQNRARAKRYYENNLAKIATKRKEARDECKECKEEVKSQAARRGSRLQLYRIFEFQSLFLPHF